MKRMNVFFFIGFPQHIDPFDLPLIPSRFNRLASLLAEAIETNDMQEILHLLRKGCPPDFQYLDAKPVNNTIIPTTLINAGIDPSQAGGELLLFLIGNREFKFLHELLDYGVDIDYLGKHKNITPLMRASYFGITPMVEYLITRGADINKTNMLKYSALTCAAVNESNLETIECLISHGSNYLIKDTEGSSLLFSAHNSLLNYFIQLGIDINETNNDGLTPLMQACGEEDDDRAIILVELGADVNYADKRGWTALLITVNVSLEIMVRFLLAHGANINHQEEDGFSPLLLASFKGYYSIVKLLLMKGAKVNLKNNEGKTALTLAKEKHFDQICQMISLYGGVEEPTINEENFQAEIEVWSTCSGEDEDSNIEEIEDLNNNQTISKREEDSGR